VPVAHRVVPDEPRLVRRHALDLAADEEEALRAFQRTNPHASAELRGQIVKWR